MRDARMTRTLRRTFDRTACVFRPLSDGTERAVYVDIPCALSRSALTSAPSVGAEGAALGVSRYALSRYTMPEGWLRRGDRVTVSDKSGRIYHARASDSVRYPSHCVTVVEVTEVSVPASQGSAEGGTAAQAGCRPLTASKGWSLCESEPALRGAARGVPRAARLTKRADAL